MRWTRDEHGRRLIRSPSSRSREGGPPGRWRRSLWPARCGCGYVFQDAESWQVYVDLLWVRPDTGEEMTTADAPPGAMWDAWWLPEGPFWRGPDGKALMVRTPDGWDWHIDGPASNCGRPTEQSKHKCWVRHGTPPLLTVDKNGETCSAGAGSIQTPKWHGFLRNGELVT